MPPNFKTYSIYAADMFPYGLEECISHLVWTILILDFGGNNECIKQTVRSLLALHETCYPEINVDQYKNHRINLQQLHSIVTKTDK